MNTPTVHDGGSLADSEMHNGDYAALDAMIEELRNQSGATVGKSWADVLGKPPAPSPDHVQGGSPVSQTPVAESALTEDPTLLAQLDQHDEIEERLEVHIRRAAVQLREAYDRRLSEIRSKYQLHMIEVENQQAKELRLLQDSFNRQKSALDDMLRRL